MKGITFEDKFFTGISLEKFQEILAGKPGICHSEGLDGRYHIFNCPGDWSILGAFGGSDQCRDSAGETRPMPEGWNVFTRRWFPGWLLFSTWADYDRAQEKKQIVKLKEENDNLARELDNVRNVLREIEKLNDAGGPGSRRAVRTLINSCI